MTLMKSALTLGSMVRARQLARGIQNVGINDALGLVGLERRRSAMEKVLPAVGWLGLGTALGAGAALLLAPTSGRELRARVSDQLDEAKQQVEKDLHGVKARIPQARQRSGS
jgi:hypothetical protein